METIKELLDNDIYLDIIKGLGVDNFNQDVQSVEVEELKNRLRQRQFLLEGFNCKVLSEQEMVQFYKQMISEYRKDIILWSKRFWKYSDDIIEEYPDGEFPKGEEISKEDVSTVNDTLRMYKNDDIRMYNFNCITDTIVEVITTCNTYTLLTVHLL